jgi:hypothetical protein
LPINWGVGRGRGLLNEEKEGVISKKKEGSTGLECIWGEEEEENLWRKMGLWYWSPGSAMRPVCCAVSKAKLQAKSGALCLRIAIRLFLLVLVRVIMPLNSEYLFSGRIVAP